MCYSALVRQDLHEIARRFGAEIAYEMFANSSAGASTMRASRSRAPWSRTFFIPGTRSSSGSRRTSKPTGRGAWRNGRRICSPEEAAGGGRTQPERAETRKAREDVRIATKKIEANRTRLSDVRRTNLTEEDTRIFPLTYVPIIANLEGRLQVAPLRYTCRLAGKPASYDASFRGRTSRGATAWAVSGPRCLDGGTPS